MPPEVSAGYAQRAMNKAETAWVEIKIDYMTAADALYWDRTIQADIVADGIREMMAGRPMPRADLYWTWTGLRVLFPLAQRLNRRRCRALSVFVENDLGQGVPAGMVLLIEQYPWLFPLQAPATESTFLWFIASAPRESLIKRGVEDPPPLGRILIDTALVTSSALGHEGQMWLHAAPAGGARLIGFYVNTCKLRQLGQGAQLPNGIGSDGRHCYASAVLATRLIDELQLTR